MLIDHHQRVDDVAFRLRHLLAFFIPNHRVEIDFFEGHIAHEVHAHHNRPGNPEENDIKSGF